MNAAVGKSSICHIDGENGVLSYRGYAIEELAEKSTFLEVSIGSVEDHPLLGSVLDNIHSSRNIGISR